MSDVTVLGSVEIAAEEAALFQAEVALIPDKAKTPRKTRKAVKVVPVVEEVTVKSFDALWEAAQKAGVPAAAPEPVAPKVDLSNLLNGLVDDVFGDKVPELEVMLEMRNEGFAKLDAAKAMGLYGLEAAAKSEMRRLDNITRKKASFQVFDDLRKSSDRQNKITLAVMDELKLHFDGKVDKVDPFKKERFSAIILAALNRVPEWKQEHEENMAQAEKVWAEFEEKKLEHDILLEEGAKLLDLANEIARTHGWPETGQHKSNGRK